MTHPELLRLSNTLFVAVIFVDVVAMAAFFARAIWRRPATGVAAVLVTVGGLVLHLGSLVARARAAGRVPWGNMYEFSMAGAFVMITVFLTVVYPRYRVPLLGGAVLGL